MIQNNVRETTNNLAKSYERLSSGLRINSAVDDAAGLALATKVKTDERLSDVAVRNINDGISMVSIAQAALDEQSAILSRLQELAATAEGGSLSVTQQSAYNEEYRSLVKELGRIGDAATWDRVGGDIALLAASRGTNPSSAAIQAGITSGASSQISISFTDSASFQGVIDRDDLRSAAVVNADMDISTLSTYFQDQLMSFEAVDSGGTIRQFVAGVSTSAGTLTFNFYIQNDDAATPPADASQWKYVSASSATFNTTTGVFSSSSFTAGISGFTGGATATVSMDLRGLRVSSTSATGAPNLGETSNLEMSGIETSARATNASSILELRKTSLDAASASFNATASRFESAVQYMSVERENYGAAYDRITSIDAAEETATMTALQIKRDQGIAALASANQSAEAALRLLEGALAA